ncbi:MAG: hypothetical protein IJ292_00180 [Clostridia bacterium]|nr:hypothetical protein [Clostridia bacterium]
MKSINKLMLTFLLCVVVVFCACGKEDITNTPIDNETILDDTTADSTGTTVLFETTGTPEDETTTHVSETTILVEETSTETSVPEEETTVTPESTNAPETTEAIKAPNTTQVDLPHNHNYYRPQHPWVYVNNGVWDGSGWHDEQNRGKIRPTCTERGFTVYVCSDCGHVKYDDYVSALGHSYTTWYVVKEATTTETGIKECRCSRCGKAPITEEIPKKDAVADECFIDPRITKRKIFGKTVYEYGDCDVCDRRTWGNVLSIFILDNGGLHVIYDDKNGEMVEFDVLPLDNYASGGNILDDGTYTTSYVGAFS